MNILRKSLCVAVLSGAVLEGAAQSPSFNVGKYLSQQTEIISALNRYYVDTLAIDHLLRVGIDAMLKEVDPYTVYYPEEEHESLDMMTNGTYGGVGAVIQKQLDSTIMVTTPYEGSPAVKSGLQPGDKILAVNGESTHNMTINDCSSKMRGTPNTTVTLTVKKVRSGEVKDVDVLREQIRINDVVYYGFVNDTTGYIQLGGFTRGGAMEVKKAVLEMKESGRMKCLVLDLRGNGGGLMSEAIDIVSLFVPKGTVALTQKGRAEGTTTSFKTKNAPVDTLTKMIVMINGESASSSEIVAGALQDLDRAVIAGTKSFGKGLVQTVLPLNFNGSLKITTSKYYTPSGRCVQARSYTHSGGQVTKITDTLEYRTASGKVVHGGGGITPDIECKAKNYTRPVASLLLYTTIPSDWVIDYYRRHESIAEPAKFALSDADFEDFVKYAKDKEFDDRTETKVEMEEAVAAAKREAIADAATIEAMEKTLAGLSLGKEHLIRVNKDVIVEYLESEIVTKYYYFRGAAQHSLLTDEQLAAALKN